MSLGKYCYTESTTVTRNGSFSVPRRARPGPTNARTFREQIRELARSEHPKSGSSVAAEPITDVDTTAADMLRDIDEELNASDVHLVFAEMKDPVRRKIDRYELTRTIDPLHFFPTVEAAVDAFQKKTGAAWVPAARDEED